jgi:hypothetical protein
MDQDLQVLGLSTYCPLESVKLTSLQSSWSISKKRAYALDTIKNKVRFAKALYMRMYNINRFRKPTARLVQ